MALNQNEGNDSILKLQQLNDWLKDKIGTIIFYPPIYDKAAIAAAIQPQRNFSGKHFILMTKSKDDFKTVHSFPKDFFDDNIFVDYLVPVGTKNSILDAAIKIGAYIMVDDLQTFYDNKLSNIFKQMNDKTKLIFLSGYETSAEALENIRKDFSNIGNLYTEFTLNEPTINFFDTKNLTYMSQLQSHVHANIESDKKELINNFLYPEDIQKYYNLKPEEQINYKTYPDVDISKGGWLNPSIIPMLHKYSTKFKNLLIKLEQDKVLNIRHIIISQYWSNNGLSILSTILDYMDIKHSIIGLHLNGEENKTNMENFNKGLGGNIILIVIPGQGDKSNYDPLNKYNFIGIYNVHILDGYYYEYVKKIIAKTIKRRNYGLIESDISFNFHLSIPDDISITDNIDDFLGQFKEGINLKENYLDIIRPILKSFETNIELSQSLIVNGSKGLYVV